MTKPSKSKKDSRAIKAEALKLASGHKVEGQTKEQTQLIAKGIQRGLEQFLRQKSEQSRDLDKRSKQLKKATQQLQIERQSNPDESAENTITASRGMIYLPWGLLLLSWLIMAFLLTPQ